MHISGKIFAGLVVVGAIAAVFMSAKALAIRNAWMEQAQKNEALIRKNDEQIELKTRELRKVRGELARTFLGWDRYWTKIRGNVSPQGLLTIGVGSTLGIQPDQVLQVFAINPEGGSKYVGDFKVTRVAETACEAKPNWLLAAGDVTPRPEFEARVWATIPGQYQARLTALDQQLLAATQTLATNQNELARQTELQDQTEKLIATRLSEIEGAPGLEGKPLPEVYIKGLLSGMVNEEEARNKALLEADRLRRELKNVREQFEATLKANRDLTESLPQGGPTETTVGSTSR